MKILDAKSLYSGIDGLSDKLKSQMDQLQQLKNVVEEFSDLNDAFKGKGGEAIRGFYQDWHAPILSFYYYTLRNYEKVLTKVKEASKDFESDSNGFIRQSFLDGELTNGINKIKALTADLVDEANSTMDQVNDIVYVQRLDDNRFHHQITRADKKINKTIEDLNTFDTSQTNELNSVEQDIQLMNQYITEIQSMFQSGELSIESYNHDLLKEKPSYSSLETALVKRNTMAFGEVLTSPFDYVNQNLSFADTMVAGYQAFTTIPTLWIARKLKVRYLGSKPTVWQKVRGKYEFSVKMDPSWTSKSKHSSKLAKKLLDFSRAPVPSNPGMKGLQKFVQSYQSPSHLYKHVAGFPKNVNKLTGKELLKGVTERMKTGTKEVVGKAVTKSGFAVAGKRIPILGTGISVVANTGELFSSENKDKSLSEKVGRMTSGIVADMATIGIGAKVGATIGSVGGPVGIIVGGAVGAFVGGLASSKVGDVAKDIGGKFGKALGNEGGKLKESISSWFN
jgi:hypothetical protein